MSERSNERQERIIDKMEWPVLARPSTYKRAGKFLAREAASGAVSFAAVSAIPYVIPTTVEIGKEFAGKKRPPKRRDIIHRFTDNLSLPTTVHIPRISVMVGATLGIAGWVGQATLYFGALATQGTEGLKYLAPIVATNFASLGYECLRNYMKERRIQRANARARKESELEERIPEEELSANSEQ